MSRSTGNVHCVNAASLAPNYAAIQNTWHSNSTIVTE